MIKKETVFVIGAGGSVHLDFPTTRELRRRIIDFTKPKYEDDWGRLGIDRGDLHQFRTSFQSSGQTSIDSFLALRPEFGRIGKLAIARSLIEFEDDAALWRHTEYQDIIEDERTNWYEYLFTLLHTGANTFEEFKKNHFYVITFNYDRSLEHYLAKCIMASYKTDYGVAVKFLHARFRHVHGSLGVLGMEPGERPYSPDLNSVTVAQAADHIRVVHERDDDRFTVEMAMRLREANRVLFLGFGYDRTNLSRIGMDGLNLQSAWGTCYGLEPGEIGAVSFRYKVQFQGNDAKTIEPLLRNQMPLIINH